MDHYKSITHEAVPRDDRRRLLSAHEVAVPLLLAAAPIELTAGTVDYLGLLDAGLVQVIDTRLVMTDQGRMVLGRLLSI